jgi:hypothetical protein
MTRKTSETANRRMMHLFYTEDGQFIYVSADRETLALNTYKLFIGRGKAMREVTIDSVDRRRDGGTTFIRTDEGVLFSPSPRKAKMDPSWRRAELIKVDPSLFEISESDKGVRIAPKKIAKPAPDPAPDKE